MAISKLAIQRRFFNSKATRGVLFGITDILDGLCAILTLGRWYPAISFHLLVWWEENRFHLTEAYKKYLKSKQQ